MLSPKTYLFEVFNVFVILIFILRLLSQLTAMVMAGQLVNQFTLLLCNLDLSSFLSERFVEIAVASQ